MATKLLQVTRGNRDEKNLALLVSCLLAGGVALLPTDSLYSLVASANKTSALDKICKIKNIRSEKVLFSVFCHDISAVSALTAQMEKSVFKIIKKNTPGPFTFILKASHSINKILKNRKETVGIRIPDHPLWEVLTNFMNHPVIGSSAPGQDAIFDEDDHLNWVNTIASQVDFIWDEGFSYPHQCAIVDCTAINIQVLREGPLPLQWS